MYVACCIYASAGTIIQCRYSACPHKREKRNPSSTISSHFPSLMVKYGSATFRCVYGLSSGVLSCLNRSILPAIVSQIVEKDPLQPNGPPQTSLVEIGPRFVLTPIRIFEGAFSGATVYSNPGQRGPLSACYGYC